MRHELTDEQWEAIEDIFPEPASTGRHAMDRRVVMNAMIWLNNTPPHQNVWVKFGSGSFARLWYKASTSVSGVRNP